MQAGSNVSNSRKKANRIVRKTRVRIQIQPSIAREEATTHKVIPFGRIDGPRITQMDLAEVALLRKRRREVERALQNKRNEIARALEEGAEIEPGLREVHLRGKRMVFY